jgi:hypothetical protein
VHQRHNGGGSPIEEVCFTRAQKLQNSLQQPKPKEGRKEVKSLMRKLLNLIIKPKKN